MDWLCIGGVNVIKLTEEMRERLYTKGCYIGARQYYEYNRGLHLVSKFDKHGLVLLESRVEDLGLWKSIKDLKERSHGKT